jgi:hypothetical protein
VPSTIVNISDAGVAAQQADTQTQQGVVDSALVKSNSYPNAVVGEPLSVFLLHERPAVVKLFALDAQESTTYNAQPMAKSQEALDTMHIQLDALQKTIQTERPSLAKTSWDFVLKWDTASENAGPKDGKIEVTGVTNAQDKKWLEDKLNGDAKMVKGVKDFYSAVVTYYDHTADHPSPTVRHGYILSGYVENVAQQINGTLDVKTLIDKGIADGGKVASTGRPYFGDVLFDKVGRQLVSTTKPTYASLGELAGL